MMASASGPAREQPERARRERHDQRLAREQAADLARRRAERAQDGGLAAALRDRGAKVPATTNSAIGARDAAERPEDRDEAGAARGRRVAGVGVRGTAGRGRRCRGRGAPQVGRGGPAAGVPGRR